MKTKLLLISPSYDPWLTELIDIYEKKISPFKPFEVIKLKNKGLSRTQAVAKQNQEEDIFFSKITDKDYLIVFDEGGKKLDSLEFSKVLSQSIESGKANVVFLIGGPFGVGEKIKQRADKIISLSELTFSHHVAAAVALEQIYRAWTIRSGQKYHNQ